MQEIIHPPLTPWKSPSTIKKSALKAITFACSEAYNLIFRHRSNREKVIAAILNNLALHTKRFGNANQWIALPYLSITSTEIDMLTTSSSALQAMTPAQSIVLLVIDRKCNLENLPDSVVLIDFNHYVNKSTSFTQKKNYYMIFY